MIIFWKPTINILVYFQGARQEDQGVNQQKAEDDAKVWFLDNTYHRE